MNQPKTLIDVKPIHEQKPVDAGTIVDACSCITATLIDHPSYEKLMAYLPEYVLGIWQDRSTDLSNLKPVERLWIVNEVLHGRTFLPTAAETVGCTWHFDGISVQDVTHLIRYRRGSFSAQCTGDRYMTDETFAIPSIIAESPFAEKYKDLMKQIQAFYNDLVYEGNISPLDARYVMPMGKTTFYNARFSISDSFAIIRQRIDRNIQPMSDNVLAYRMYQELLKYFPGLYDMIDLDAIPKWYFATMDTAFCSNLYQPELQHKTDFDPDNYVYGQRPWPVEFKKVYDEVKQAQEEAKQRWSLILNDLYGMTIESFNNDIKKFTRFIEGSEKMYVVQKEDVEELV